MKPNTNLSSIITTAIKVFFIGMLVHFFMHTFVTHQLGRTHSIRQIIRAWKEIWIVVALCWIGYQLYNYYQKQTIQQRWSSFPLKKYTIIIIITSIIILITGLAIHPVGLGSTIMSRRYSMTGFLLFVIGAAIVLLRSGKNTINREKWYIKVIKYLLIGGIVRRWLIYFLPSFIELFGYNKYIYEGQVGQQPPAVYYTQITQGMVRNQFLFERPIHRAMFLIAFWPLFFIIAIKDKSLQAQIGRGVIYGLNIISTLSRAAWIAWIIQTAIILLILHHKHIKKLILYGFIPGVVILGLITYRARDDMIHRSFSNLGHIKHTMTAIQKVSQKPIQGRGPGSAGPASHHRKDVTNYNPENQYLQIWIEYGLLGFLGWMYLYLRPQILGYRSYKKLQEYKFTKEQKNRSWIIISLAIGLLGLTIEGFFLHSFVDRMIVYPLMLLFGISFGYYRQSAYRAQKD